jgi:hypothetical protein
VADTTIFNPPQLDIEVNVTQHLCNLTWFLDGFKIQPNKLFSQFPQHVTHQLISEVSMKNMVNQPHRPS